MASTVPSIKLNDGTSIPQLGFGVYLVGSQSAEELTYNALKTGYRHIDTAEFYKNEAEVVAGIKKWLDEDPANNKRSDVYYTTKVAPKVISKIESKDSIKERVKIAKDIGYIDLVLIHSPGGGKESRLTSYKELQDFKDENPDAVRSYGVSNYSNAHLTELLEWDGLKYKPVINQIEVNPWLTRKENVDFAKKHDIAVEAYSPLTRGKRIDDPELIALAKKYNKTTGQILLRWSLEQGLIPLAKTETYSRLAENLNIFDFKLSDDDHKSLTHDDQYWVSAPHWDPIKNEL